MKCYWIASTIEIKTQATKNMLCACKMRGGRDHAAQQYKFRKRVSPDTKNVLSDNRRSLAFDNLRKLVVVYCNNAE